MAGLPIAFNLFIFYLVAEIFFLIKTLIEVHYGSDVGYIEARGKLHQRQITWVKDFLRSY